MFKLVKSLDTSSINTCTDATAKKIIWDNASKVLTCADDQKGASSGGTVTGTGSNNYLTKWTGASSIGNSVISEDSATGRITISNNIDYPLRVSTTQAGAGSHAIVSTSTNGAGIYGESTSGYGTYGISRTSYGAVGWSGGYNPASQVFSGSTGVYGISGISVSSDTTIAGVRGDSSETAGIGVYGVSDSGTGVYGYSSSGDGVYAKSASGYALHVVDRAKFDSTIEISSSLFLSGGDPIKKVNFNDVTLGSCAFPASKCSWSVIFPYAFTSTPVVVVEPYSPTGATDVFATTLSSVSTTGFTVQVYRVDGTGWSQDLHIHYWAAAQS